MVVCQKQPKQPPAIEWNKRRCISSSLRTWTRTLGRRSLQSSIGGNVQIPRQHVQYHEIKFTMKAIERKCLKSVNADKERQETATHTPGRAEGEQDASIQCPFVSALLSSTVLPTLCSLGYSCCCCCDFVFQVRVPLCCPGYPGTCSVD